MALSGDTLSRVTNDVDTAAQSLNQSLGTVLSSSLLVVAVLVTMFGMNWILALVTVVSTLIGFAFVSVFMGKSRASLRVSNKIWQLSMAMWRKCTLAIMW